MSEIQIADMTQDEYRLAIISIVASGNGYRAIKDITSELEKRDEIAYAVFREVRARLTAVDKIANSSQTAKQKVNGIKPLADMRGDT